MTQNSQCIYTTSEIFLSVSISRDGNAVYLFQFLCDVETFVSIYVLDTRLAFP